VNIEFQMDSSEVVCMITDSGSDFSRLSYLVLEVLIILTLSPIIKISKIDRSQNRASHVIAKFARLHKRTANHVQKNFCIYFFTKWRNIPALASNRCIWIFLITYCKVHKTYYNSRISQIGHIYQPA
jgi:hypothetical protein